MKVTAIKTNIFNRDMNLLEFIFQNTKNKLKEKSILFITSKIVSLAERRTLNKDKIDKKTLIKKECEHYLGEIGYGCHLTIRQGLLLPSAGIDESNSLKGEYILYPKDPFSSAEKITRAMKKKLSLKDFGLVLTDSRTLPLRQGVVGVALAYSGFKAIKNLIGQPDLFGRELKITRINIVDALAASAVLLMGEGAEQCPLAIAQEIPLEFTNKTDPSELKISIKEDLYNPLYRDRIFT